MEFSVNTVQNVPHNKSDFIIWIAQKNPCNIAKCSCPTNTNVIGKEEEKMLIYVPLVKNVQIIGQSYII